VRDFTHRHQHDFEYRPFPDDVGRNVRQARLEIPLFVRALGIEAGRRILEIGCGRGVALPVIGRLCRPDRLVGVDIDDSLLEEAAAHTRGLDVELVCADVRALPFRNETFDVVIDFGTCYHIGNPAKAIAEITRVLVPGGLFCHETPLNQVLSHPIRSGGRRLPFHDAPELSGHRRALMWSSRRRDQYPRRSALGARRSAAETHRGYAGAGERSGHGIAAISGSCRSLPQAPDRSLVAFDPGHHVWSSPQARVCLARVAPSP
jgi:SAM-dependent methyltransferase